MHGYQRYEKAHASLPPHADNLVYLRTEAITALRPHDENWWRCKLHGDNSGEWYFIRSGLANILLED